MEYEEEEETEARRCCQAIPNFQGYVNGVRQFLGLAAYYYQFIPQFEKLTEPLHHMTGKYVCTNPMDTRLSGGF